MTRQLKTNCICSKEKEIAEINGNIKLILNEVQHVKKKLDGNGKKGLTDQVIENSAYILLDKERYTQEIDKKKNLWGNGWLLAIIMLVITLIANGKQILENIFG